jgi:hypothetical protein
MKGTSKNPALEASISFKQRIEFASREGWDGMGWRDDEPVSSTQ